MDGDELYSVIAKVLDHSFTGIKYDFKRLTTVEKEIVKDQATLDELELFVKQHK